MPTANPSVSTSWTKIAESSNTELLASWDAPVQVEFATTSADAAPGVSGHRLERGSCITRALIGSGYVWARLVKNGGPTSINLVVTK